MTPSEFKPDVWYRRRNDPLIGDAKWDSDSESWMCRVDGREWIPRGSGMTYPMVTRTDWEPVVPEKPACPDYGEPWKVEAAYTVDRYGRLLGCSGVDRLVACVNALAGITDPEAWVRERRVPT